MNRKGEEFFGELMEYHNGQGSPAEKYPRLRGLLERVCRDLTLEETTRFSSLFSRLNFVCKKTRLDRRRTWQINCFRVNANAVAHGGLRPSEEEYLQDLKAFSHILAHFYNLPVPAELARQLPLKDHYDRKRITGTELPRARVEVISVDEEFIYVQDEDTPTEDPLKVRHHVRDINEEFNPTIALLKEGSQVNLLDIIIDENGIYFPRIIILEPDYLVDTSSLAECMKEYGSHPLNFLQNKLTPLVNTRHSLLGQVANLFLDEFVNEDKTNGRSVNYEDAVRAAFHSAPFDFSTCTDLVNKENEAAFFRDTKLHFQNIRRVVTEIFPQNSIDKENGIIEPSFICEQLGIQGRLDFLELKSRAGGQFVVELKSGKAPFPDTNTRLISKNHRAQAFLYQIMIQKVLGADFNKLRTFVLYSRYTDRDANLRPADPFMNAIKMILDLRNHVVANERKIAFDETGRQAQTLLDAISPATLITEQKGNPVFIENYIIPAIEKFQSYFQRATPVELSYFFSLYTFVTKEHYISKAGGMDYDKGFSSLWHSSLDEKKEAGEILFGLRILENDREGAQHRIRFRIPAEDYDYLHNFRQGDIIVLYERNSDDDDVTNKQTFKGAIERLHRDEITVRLRYRQRNQQSVLLSDCCYAIEHDHLDSSYNAMYRGLFAFLHANRDRKDLLLNARPPVQDLTVTLNGTYPSDYIRSIVHKAKSAKDYFLLVGPPGSGKTKLALRSMVEEFYSDGTTNILLLSFTNRAVDEICNALDLAADQPPYIRVGSEFSCAERHRAKLLECLIEDCKTRKAVRKRIQQYRIFVGTVASISGKLELFQLKHFQVAIIDEASQILEPHLSGILSAKNPDGANAIGKFILVGDHKQLPAVVLQKEKDSKVTDPVLNAMGLFDRRNSLFERLYNLHKSDKSSPVWSMLYKQGRMHPAIARFPNEEFYQGLLEPVPMPHQAAPLEFLRYEKGNGLQELIATQRLAFFPTERNQEGGIKSNAHEAEIAASLVKNIYELYEQNGLPFDPEKSIGVITSYRNQVALIRRKIHELGIALLDEVHVDTVERFQGSERDIIIYSFSVNRTYQLDLLVNSMEDEGQAIDRKLNVAITRARKQLFITGNPAILEGNRIYGRLIAFVKANGAYVDGSSNLHPS